MARKDLGEALVEKGVITTEQLNQAREVQRSAPGDIGRIIVDLGFADNKAATKVRAETMNLSFVDLSTQKIDQAAVNSVPEHIAKRHKVLPIAKNGNRLIVAVVNPSDLLAIQDIKLASGVQQIAMALSTEDDVMDAIDRMYKSGDSTATPANAAATDLAAVAAPEGGAANTSGLSADIRQAIAGYGAREDILDEDTESIAKVSEEAPIIRIAYTVIQQAISDGASDIHVEPDKRSVRIRYRIDGVLHEVMPLPKYIEKPLTSRFKIMSDMNIAERRIPQDGRIPVTLAGKDYDLRVSCLPTVNGEKIVMRILDKSSVLLGLNKLGFSPEVQAQVEELVAQPNGMFLSTGPTGSGKTTTQYSVLHKLNSVEKNIITIEDPVEYQLSGIAQVQVNKKAGLNFANALASFLRQDPDIIMVGEMRNLETGEIAVEASLTGHLVLSTLHTNDAPSAVTRMVDMGVEPYLISATVIGVLAQRLARKICSKCKAPYQVPATELRRFGFKPKDANEMVTLYRGEGCDVCRHTGFKGRLGVYELMRMNDEIRELVVRRAPLADVREAAKANGMHELKDDGLDKVLQGITTPDEVMRVVFTAGA
ncbi:MAG: Flp pilus assembly complex ATPase component TadA [Armatimonadetes bacterium]|jgi:type IV pilus assembly protein PilB|nr:Flp pilus assembly complex ATPase component TadA [Armatimonadota bacterium]